jgi:large subunit ribosomal protein L24
MVDNKIKTKLKKGDIGIMLSGKDKGKKGKVLKVWREKRKALIEGLNLVKKHQRPRRQGEKGEIISKPRFVSISAVAFYCGSCNKGVKVGYRLSGDKKERICKKCQQVI